MAHYQQQQPRQRHYKSGKSIFPSVSQVMKSPTRSDQTYQDDNKLLTEQNYKSNNADVMGQNLSQFDISDNQTRKFYSGSTTNVHFQEDRGRKNTLDFHHTRSHSNGNNAKIDGENSEKVIKRKHKINQIEIEAHDMSDQPRSSTDVIHLKQDEDPRRVVELNDHALSDYTSPQSKSKSQTPQAKKRNLFTRKNQRQDDDIRQKQQKFIQSKLRMQSMLELESMKILPIIQEERDETPQSWSRNNQSSQAHKVNKGQPNQQQIISSAVKSDKQYDDLARIDDSYSNKMSITCDQPFISTQKKIQPNEQQNQTSNFGTPQQFTMSFKDDKESKNDDQCPANEVVKNLAITQRSLSEDKFDYSLQKNYSSATKKKVNNIFQNKDQTYKTRQVQPGQLNRVKQVQRSKANSTNFEKDCMVTDSSDDDCDIDEFNLKGSSVRYPQGGRLTADQYLMKPQQKFSEKLNGKVQRPKYKLPIQTNIFRKLKVNRTLCLNCFLELDKKNKYGHNLICEAQVVKGDDLTLLANYHDIPNDDTDINKNIYILSKQAQNMIKLITQQKKIFDLRMVIQDLETIDDLAMEVFTCNSDINGINQIKQQIKGFLTYQKGKINLATLIARYLLKCTITKSESLSSFMCDNKDQIYSSITTEALRTEDINPFIDEKARNTLEQEIRQEIELSMGYHKYHNTVQNQTKHHMSKIASQEQKLDKFYH